MDDKRKPPPPRVTISDVAKDLGLTKGTVSRALNGYEDISPSTRQRVAATARRLGYTPMANAQAIRTGRVRAVGLVLHMDQHDAHRPFLAEFLQGITRAASAEGWTLTVATAETETEGNETFLRLFRDRKADGFIVPRTRLDDSRVDFLREKQIPFVLFGRTRNPSGCAWFDILSERAMRDAVHRLAKLGHRRIAFLNGDLKYTYATLRAEGFAAGISSAGLHRTPDFERDGLSTAQQGYSATRELLSREAPPTAIICATDTLAFGVVRFCGEHGLTPGKEVSVIGYDGIPEGEIIRPTLTSFYVDQKDAGERLARLLIKRTSGIAPELLRDTAPAQLRVGGTDGPPTMTPEELAACIRMNASKTETQGRTQ